MSRFMFANGYEAVKGSYRPLRIRFVLCGYMFGGYIFALVGAMTDNTWNPVARIDGLSI